MIYDKIKSSNSCIIIDEARDKEKKHEQMTIILHFIDKNGFIREHFFHVMHMKYVMTLTLKQEMYNVLSHHDILMGHIWDQGYDDVRNTRD